LVKEEDYSIIFQEKILGDIELLLKN